MSKYICPELKKLLTPVDIRELQEVCAGHKEMHETKVYDKLFNYYCNNGEMPYGTAKARTGDPDVWVANAIFDELGW